MKASNVGTFSQRIIILI